MRATRVAVVGGGVGGLAAAIDLAAAGCEVEVLERQPSPGGKLRQINVGPYRIDSGPTVLTMRWVFDALFDDAGDDFGARVPLTAATVLARHAWDDGDRLDLFADTDASADAIARFAGPREASGYREFCSRAAALFASLDEPFIRRAAPPGPVSLCLDAGVAGVLALLRASPFRSVWDVLGEHFRDERLRQLFGRYATYCGASPYSAPATLLLIAHVEQRGVWLVDGGMGRLADALVALARRLGVSFRCNTTVAAIDTERGAVSGVRSTSGERFAADAVVANADVAAIRGGLLGHAATAAIGGHVLRTPRSLSAMTWSCAMQAEGFPLSHHNVFFSTDYRREFDELFGRAAMPSDPTVYVCAQNRDTARTTDNHVGEPLLILINAPPVGDTVSFDDEEIEQCWTRTVRRLARCGLMLTPGGPGAVATTPTTFAGLFPGSGGALYGRATHGWRAAFRRPSTTTAIRGLYLAGGSVHPGPGLPMATLSGRSAARSLLRDMASRARSRQTAMPGGTSMR